MQLNLYTQALLWIAIRIGDPVARQQYQLLTDRITRLEHQLADVCSLLFSSQEIMTDRAQAISALRQQNDSLSERIAHLVTENSEAHVRIRELECLAYFDPLTGLLNRRAFETGFQQTLGLLSREKTPQPPEGMIERRHHPAPVISLLVFDLDFFKRVNDTHGHTAGDTVLVRMAQLLREHLGHRPSDMIAIWNDAESIARFGGEEFVVVLPRANTEHATGLASQFLSILAETNISITTNAGEVILINVTASCGIATIPVVGGGVSMSSALDQADKALYQAKQLGRNRVVHYDEIVGS